MGLYFYSGLDLCIFCCWGDDENLILQKGLHDPKNLKGDICRFITQREWGPGNKKWRMPTLDELKLLGDGVRETTASTPGWGYISGSSSEGSTVIGNGIRTNNRYYLPANDGGIEGDIGLLPLQSVLQPGDFTLNI